MTRRHAVTTRNHRRRSTPRGRAVTRRDAGTTRNHRRARGDDGAGLVAGIAVLFALTFLGLVWLARDVDRGISNRSAAQSIAFQAARSGAQATEIASLRTDGAPVVDMDAARRAARLTAEQLFTSYGVDGDVTRIEVDGERVVVEVTIVDGAIRVAGSGTVRAERAP